MAEHQVIRDDFLSVKFFRFTRKQSCLIKRSRKVHSGTAVFEYNVLYTFKEFIRMEAVIYRFVVGMFIKSNVQRTIVPGFPALTVYRDSVRFPADQLAVDVGIRKLRHIFKSYLRRPPEGLESFRFYPFPDQIAYAFACIQIAHGIPRCRTDESRGRAGAYKCQQPCFFEFRTVYVKLIMDAVHPFFCKCCGGGIVLIVSTHFQCSIHDVWCE